MDEFRILVVDALARASGRRYSTFDVVGAGPRVVAGLLEQLGHIVALKTYEEVLHRPELLGGVDVLMVSVMTSDLGALSRIINYARRTVGYKGIVVVGGPGSFSYEKILSVNGVDYVVIGEAEEPLLKIFSSKYLVSSLLNRELNELRNVPALVWREAGRITITSGHIHTPRDHLSRLKPWVKVNESYPHHRIYRYYVEIVRGCSNFHRPLITGYPGLNCIKCMLCYHRDLRLRLNCPAGIPPGCGFCSVPHQFGPPRSRSIESIVEEVEGLIEHGARRIVLSGPDFLDYMREELVSPDPLTDPCQPHPNYEAIEELLSRISENPMVSQRRVIVSIENIKACLVDEKVAEIMGNYLKGTTIHIGMETGDNEFNKLIGKPIGPQHVYRAVELLKRNGLRPYVYLMYGLPFMRTRTYLKTIASVRRLARLGVEKITLYKFTPLPHTAFQNLKPRTAGFEEYISRLKKLVSRVNYEGKRGLIGEKINVYLSEGDGRLYGYPVMHGPVVFIEEPDSGLKDLSGCLASVIITRVSPRNAWGRLVEVVEC